MTATDHRPAPPASAPLPEGIVVREWNGRVPADRADAYLALMNERAIPDYRRVPGNLAAFCLARVDGSVVHVTMHSWWRDIQAIAGFAGSDIGRARYYDFDSDFLLELPARVRHYTVSGALAGCWNTVADVHPRIDDRPTDRVAD